MSPMRWIRCCELSIGVRSTEGATFRLHGADVSTVQNWEGGGGTGTELFTCPYPLKVQVQPTTNCLYKSGISIPNIAYLCLTYIYGLRT